MRKRIFVSLFGIALLVSGVPAAAAPTHADLTLWTADSLSSSGILAPSPGNWVVNPTGTSAVQTVNGAPTFFYSPTPVDGQRVVGEFATPSFDDDFFGIALGFSTSSNDPSADYLLIDWRQGDQTVDFLDGTEPAVAPRGLAVSRVTGVPSLNEMWGHFNSSANPNGGVVELARGATLGSTGWADGSTYVITVEYTTETLDVWVDGSHEISLTGVFPQGPYALYNYSQPDLTVSALTFEPLNRAPEVIDGGAADISGDEGTEGTTSGAFTDPDGDLLELACLGECGGFSVDGNGEWSWTAQLIEGPGAYTVTVVASDGALEASDSFDVTIANVAPHIISTSLLPSRLDLSEAVNVEADFVDAGIEDTHTAMFTWGDGTSSPGVVNEIPGSGEASALHTYSSPGIYTVSITVWDDDGDFDSVVLGEIFVFDPDTFVTGGGWFTSPPGAWVSQPTHSGKGTFGFVAKYSKSGDVKGSVQFQLHKGINLHSNSLNSLLISDGIASFRGVGTVNRQEGYDFLVIATDERYASSDVDRFWITIWHGGDVVYDGTFLGAGGEIVGRGIQIHQ